MRYHEILFLLIFVLSVQSNEGYRILCLFPFNGGSHFKMFEALCKGLARRGHRIDAISHFPTKKSIANYTDIVDLSGTRENIRNSFSIEYGKSLHKAITYYIASEFGGSLCELMGHEGMQKFIKNPPNDPPYDLVITEYLGSVCYLGFGPLLKAPIAIALSFNDWAHVNHFMGNPMSYAFFSGSSYEKAVLNTFFDRLWNLLTNYIEIQLFYRYTSDQTEIMRKYLGRDLPDVRQLENTVSLALINGHHSFHGIRPITPAIVEVGGLHVEFDESELTGDLKTWMDSADHGIVYFTLGSLTNIETLPESTILDLYASFANISPVKVLMRCVDIAKLPPGLPSNVLTSPWVPQIAVLRHKNTRIFITHGGLMGVQEALYHGVPMIGIPLFADQAKNVNILVEKGMAILIDVDNVTEISMNAALNDILRDPKYRESARKESKLFRDRPMSPMDTAAFWIEYVIRNKPNSLRSPAMDMPWWKLNLIDVFLFLIASLILGIYLLWSLLTILFMNFSKSSTQSEKKLK